MEEERSQNLRVQRLKTNFFSLLFVLGAPKNLFYRSKQILSNLAGKGTGHNSTLNPSL